jgi:hypothetical protein
MAVLKSAGRVVLGLCWLAGAAAAAPTRIPGTRVTLDPPEGFTPAEQFPGFQRTDQGASILVTEMPGRVVEVYAGMNKEALASRGITLLGKERLTVGGREAVLYHVTQEAGAGIVVEKWIALFGDDAHAVMVVGGFQQGTAGSMSDAMKRAVLSASWHPDQAVDWFEGLPFRVTETSSLKVGNRMSNGVMLAKPGTLGAMRPEDALVAVRAATEVLDIQDLESFAKERIGRTDGMTDLNRVIGKSTTVGGLPAYELTADAIDAKSGTAVQLYQLVVADGRQFFLVQGRVGRAQADEFMPQFGQVGTSLRRTP